MARFVKGEVVVVPFPFSNLTNAKLRPAVVLANLPGTEVLICSITSKQPRDQADLPLTNQHFQHGGLRLPSTIRPHHVFTIQESLITRSVGQLLPAHLLLVIDRLTMVVTQW